ncbi:MAG: hypothetical protein IJ799_04230 [Bacteroidales bacterium]|nr:hypothetical protein [Bacteroidales bacterium]
MKNIILLLCAALLVIPSCKKAAPDADKDGNGAGNSQYSAEGVNAVDLGLSVLWADRNIGAESPEDPGDFFAWGETTARNYNSFARPYIFDEAEAPAKLSGGYDTATALWGDGWRMPTKEELLALGKLTCEEVKDTEGNIIGYTVSGNGNNIHIPVVNPEASSRSLALWSSERGVSDPVWAYYFSMFGGGIANCRREYAHAVRPVKAK